MFNRRTVRRVLLRVRRTCAWGLPLVLVASLLTLLPVQTAQAVTTYRQFEPSTLVFQHSGKCLDVDTATNGLANGAKVQQYDCLGGKNQTWTLVNAGNFYGTRIYTVRAAHSGKCLDVTNQATADGSPLQQWDCTGGNNQLFYPIRTNGDEPAGIHELRNLSSGKCIDMPGSRTDNGAQAIIYACTGTANQRFRMRTYGAAGEVDSFRFKTFSISDMAELQVNVTTGNVMYKQTDLSAPALGVPMEIVRFYNSLSEVRGPGRTSPMGNDWQLNMGGDVYRDSVSDGGKSSARVRMPSGYSALFADNGSSYLVPPMGLSRLQMDKLSAYSIKSLDTGGVMEFQQNGQLTAIRDRFGNQITTQYAVNNQTTSITDPKGRVITFTYNSSDYATGKVTAITDWAGRQATYTYDASGNLIASKDLTGQTIGYAYNAQGKLATVTDPRGYKTQISYNADGRVFTVQQSGQAQATTFYYNTGRGECTFDGVNSGVPEPGLPASVIDSTSVSGPDTTFAIAYCYDTEGRVVRTIGRNGQVTEQTWDKDSDRTKIGWGDGARLNTYDPSQRLTSTTEPTGARRSFGYGDPANPYLPTSATDVQGNTMNLAYSNGLLTAATDPHSRTQRFTYNANGTTATATDRRGNQTTYTYNTLGQLSQVTQPGIGSTGMTYDSVGRIRTVTDGKGQQTTLSYDNLNRPTQASYADGSAVEMTYDGNGNMLTSTELQGGVVTNRSIYTYDQLNQLERESLPGGAAHSFTYDARGNMTSYSDSTGITRLAFSVGDLLESITDPSGAKTLYYFTRIQGSNLQPSAIPTYSTHPAEVRYPNGTSVHNVVDRADRVVRTTVYRTVDNNQLADPSKSLMDLRYSYSRAGTDTELVQSMTNAKNGDVTTYRYDANNQLIGRTVENSAGTVLATNVYNYDAAGNRTADYIALVAAHSNKCLDVAAGSDKNNASIVQYYCSGSPAQNFAMQLAPGGYYSLVNEKSGKCLDVEGYSTADGARIQQYKCTGASNQLFRLTFQVGGYQFTNKGSGKCIDVSGASTADGASVLQWSCHTGGNQQFAQHGRSPSRTYNSANQLTAEGSSTFSYDTNGNLTAGPGASLTYNAKNQTASMTGMGNPKFIGFGQSQMISAGSAPIEETADLGITRIGPDTFIRAPGGAPVSMTTASGKFYYVPDPQGNVVATLDSAGNIASTYAYDPFGANRGTTGSALSPLRFQSEYLANPGQDTYKIGERFYDSRKGRWTQADPMLAENRYIYADNDPINRHDPSGLFTGPAYAACVTAATIAGGEIGWQTGNYYGKHSGLKNGGWQGFLKNRIQAQAGLAGGGAFGLIAVFLCKSGPGGGMRKFGTPPVGGNPGGLGPTARAVRGPLFPGSTMLQPDLERAVKGAAMVSLIAGTLLGHCT